MPRTAARTDANHEEIANAFAGMGCSVQSLASQGGGVPDLLIGFGVGIFQLNLLVEVKSGNAKLTEDQERWHSNWRGQKAIIRSVEEAGQLVKSAKALFSMIEESTDD